MVASRIPSIVAINIAYWPLISLNRLYMIYVDIDITNPIIRKFAPNDVRPPIPNSNACASKLMKDTRHALYGPNRNTSNAIVKKCIGKPRGDGIDNDEMTVVKTA